MVPIVFVFDAFVLNFVWCLHGQLYFLCDDLFLVLRFGIGVFPALPPFGISQLHFAFR